MVRKIQTPLDSAPAHAIALGRMLGHWAILEHCLSDVLGGLLGIEQSRQQLLFNTFIGLSGKIQLIERLIYSYAIDGDEKTFLLDLVEKASQLNTMRNSFVHSTWAAGAPETLTKFDMRVPSNKKHRFRPVEEIKVQDIESFVEELSVLSAEFQEFQFDVFPRMQISLHPLK